jgi:hypothetical protein
VPFGSVDGGDTGALSHYTSGAFPLVVDADVRLPGHFLVGVLFQYASLRDPADCGNNCFPSSSATRLGVTLGYRRELGTRLRAQAGLGVGYEWLAVNGSEELRWSGLELGRLETGADYLVAPRVALGPFVSFSLSRYTNGPLDVMGNANPPALHSWLLFGVRAGFSVWP